MQSTLEKTNATPDRFKQLSINAIQFTEGGGLASLLGLPFLGVGIFLFLIGFGLIPFGNADEITEGWMPIMLFVMATAFTAVGGGLVFGRKWYTFDRGRGTISIAKGLLVPMTRQERNLGLFNTVLLEHETGDSDSAERFPVWIKGTGTEKPLLIDAPTNYAKARQTAVYLAEFLRFTFEDATTDHTDRIAADQLHHTYRERVYSDREDSYSVGQPLNMKSTVERGNGRLTITIPQPSKLKMSLLSAVIPMAAVVFFSLKAYEMFGESDAPEEARFIFYGFAALFLLIPLIGVIRALVNARRPGAVVTLDRSSMSIDSRTGRRKQSVTLSLDEILDIDYATKSEVLSALKNATGQTGYHRSDIDPRLSSKQIPQGLATALSWLGKLVPSKGITVKSQRGLHSFGEGLPDDEIRYLHSLIKEFLQR